MQNLLLFTGQRHISGFIVLVVKLYLEQLKNMVKVVFKKIYKNVFKIDSEKNCWLFIFEELEKWST